MSNVVLIVVIGVSIVAGQFAMAAFARGLEPPWLSAGFILRALSAPAFYGVVASYLLSLIAYILLLWQSTIIAANLPIMAIVVALNVLFGVVIGERLTSLQWLGVAFAVGSIGLLAGTRA